jgi:hypothetical protein
VIVFLLSSRLIIWNIERSTIISNFGSSSSFGGLLGPTDIVASKDIGFIDRWLNIILVFTITSLTPSTERRIF